MARNENTREIRQDRTQQLPRTVAVRSTRRVLVAIVGGTFVLAGLVLIIFPGPWTIPLVLLGLTILSWEFQWAKRLLFKAKWRLKQMRSKRRKKAR